MFTQHFCAHALFPDKAQSYAASEIRTKAVHEMYKFCYDRRLNEVLAYMYTQWYSKRQWNLWAQSASPFISRLCTTMGMENHWQQLKHDYLQYLLRPQIDQLIYIIQTQVLPVYMQRACILEDIN